MVQYYDPDIGWYSDEKEIPEGQYEDHSEPQLEIHEIIDQEELKIINSDGRSKCAICGNNIIEPFAGIRYCPKCQ